MTLNKDVAAGMFFILVGLFFCISVWFGLDIGTASEMGPGYFPLVLGAVLALFGLVMLVRGLASQGMPIGSISIRGTLLIGVSPIIFGASVQGLGLIAAGFLSTFVAAMSSSRVSILYAVLLSLGLTVFCVFVFSYGLGLPYPRIGPWLLIGGA